MKNILLTTIIALFAYTAHGQEGNIIKIKGRISLSDNSNPYFQGILVTFRINDSLTFSTRPDTSGHYIFYTDKKTLKKNKCLISVSPNRELLPRLNNDCLDRFEDHYTTARSEITPDKLQDTITFDFSLSLIIRESGMPKVHFKMNSCELVDGAIDSLYFIKCLILSTHNKYILQVAAYADRGEKKPMLLAQKRAEKVKEILVKLGVPSTILVTKGYGYDSAFYSEWDIKKIKNKDEKESMRQANRRISVSALSKKETKLETEE